MKNCKHKNKAYSSAMMSLTCNPPINISYWICKDCGFEGQDSERGIDFDAEYRETKQKFNKDNKHMDESIEPCKIVFN